MFFFSAASVAPHFSVAIFLQLCVKHLLSWLDFTILSSGCQSPSQVWDSQHCTLQESSAASMLRAKAERGACVLSSHLYSSRPSLPSPERATTNTTGKVWGTEMLRRAQWSEKKTFILCFLNWSKRFFNSRAMSIHLCQKDGIYSSTWEICLSCIKGPLLWKWVCQ